MTARTTTQKHSPPTEEHAAEGTPVLLLVFPEPRAIPLPPPGAATGRSYFSSHGHADREISSNHLRLSRTGSSLCIEDIGSSNGTWLDGHPLKAHDPAPLHDGALLRVGRSLFVYREALQGPLQPDPPGSHIVSPWGFRAVRQALSRLRARPEKAILIEGETGTGKELASHAVAEALGRGGPFTPVNVAALSPTTLEGHLFGHERGSFSGADRRNLGLLRASDKGTVFLDEIGELSPELQAKLLRVLENGEVLPVGAHRPVTIDVAFVAATNRDLGSLVKEGKFRKDLLARFRTRLTLPPLRERPEDLFALLVALWTRRHAPPSLANARMDVEAMELLALHDWPANARDLDRFAADVLGEGFHLRLASVRAWLGPDAGPNSAPPATPERIIEVLEECKGNQSEAARRLRVKRGVITRLLRRRPELKGSGPPRE
jgi:transcriptional regulator of acetoin/glycerol metabolism